ncbi:hypothetical protein Q3G72_009307 [Acer saccharum]|nr:hypothetical protein Q3G72_009307 [Acer saccharum]
MATGKCVNVAPMLPYGRHGDRKDCFIKSKGRHLVADQAKFGIKGFCEEEVKFGSKGVIATLMSLLYIWRHRREASIATYRRHLGSGNTGMSPQMSPWRQKDFSKHQSCHHLCRQLQCGEKDEECGEKGEECGDI